jgi:hypothetical protein
MDHGTSDDPSYTGGRSSDYLLPDFDRPQNEFEALKMRARIFNLLWWFCHCGGDGR